MRNFILWFVVLLLGAATVQAQGSGDVVGVWVLDKEATEESMQQAPEWNESIEKMLPMILAKMGQVRYVYTDTTLTIEQGEKIQVLEYTVISGGGVSPLVLEVNVGGQIMSFDVTFISSDQINMKSSATDDMDYYIWKRAQ